LITMTAAALAGSVVDAIELPKIIQLRPNLHAAAFGLMKLLPARCMLDRAADRGELEPGSMVLETSSGTLGLGLAMVCRLRGYRLTIVGDPAIDVRLQEHLRQIGAAVEICQRPSAEGGYQRARLDRLAELRERHPRHYVPNQYGNADNPNSYGVVAELLAESIGSVDCLVGAVGSGGSTVGTSSYLRLITPGLHLVGVDTPGSVIFGHPDRPRQLRGLGNSLVPPNVKHREFDEVHWIGAAEAYHAARGLLARHCLFMGPTSGAAYLAADWWARNNPHAKVVVLMPDEGHRYRDTVYSEQWFHEAGFDSCSVTRAPTVVDRPEPGPSGWTSMSWRRRSLAEVLGGTVPT
jgi:cysteine synthase A